MRKNKKTLALFMCTSIVFILFALNITGVRAKALAATSKSEEYVDVYYDNTLGTNPNTISADTANYNLGEALSTNSKEASKSLVIKQSNFPNVNVFKYNINALSPAMKVNGQWYKANYIKNSNKMIVKRAGKNLWNIEVQNIQLENSNGQILPLTVNQTFYFWNEKFYVISDWKPTYDIEGIEYAELQTTLNKDYFNKYNVGNGDVDIPSAAQWTDGTVYDQVTVFDSAANTHGAVSYEVINKSGTDSLLLQSGKYLSETDNGLALVQRAYDMDKHLQKPTIWESAHHTIMYTQVFVSGNNTSAEGIADASVEMNPLSLSEFHVTGSFPYEGSKSLGYDNTMGAYNVEVYTPNIDYYGTEANNYPSAKIQISNNEKNRKIRLKTQLPITGSNGFAPAITGGVSMLTDENLVPMGIPLQTSKKWDNTNGENSTTYSETYSSFLVQANVNKTMWHRTSFQKWGNKNNVGLPSLDLSNYGSWGALWLQTNVGLSEAMCYNPDDAGNATLTDFRAINGKQMGGPWFENAGGLEFLQLNDGTKTIDAKRRGPGMRFEELGPNLSQYTMNLQTSDGAPNVKVSVTSTLLPSSKGTRVFYKLHYDFLSDISLNNIKTDLSLFSMGDPRYSTQTVSKIAYSNDKGTVTNLDLIKENNWDVIGEALNNSKPWVGFYGTSSNNVGFAVHSFEAILNGQPLNSLAVSERSSNSKQTAYLVPNTPSNTIKAGDSADLLVEAYTWNPADGDYLPLQQESEKGITQVNVTHGTKVSDFPAKITVGKSQHAEFTVQGGVEYVPVTIDGFDKYAQPKIQEYVSGQWKEIDQSVGINDFWQTGIDEATGKYKITYALPADDNKHRYKISMVKSKSPTIPVAIAKFKSAYNYILGFDLDEKISDAVIDVAKHTVNISVREGSDLKALTPNIKVADYTSISPASGQAVDFTQSVKYITTAEDGSTQDWTITVKAKQSEVIDFTLPQQISPAIINSTNHTINLTVKAGTDITSLTPTINVTDGAIITPNSGQVKDFTSPVKYVLTGVGGATYEWTITVKVDTPSSVGGTSLNSAIADTDNWYVYGTGTKVVGAGSLTLPAGGFSSYQGTTYGNDLLRFNMIVDFKNDGGDWPSISVRNKASDRAIFDVANEGYIVCFKPGIIELQRFNGGARKYIYGGDSTLGDGSSNLFTSGQTHLIQFGAVNVDNGVRLILNVDGHSVYDYVDTDDLCIKNPGYFSVYSNNNPVTLSDVGVSQ